MDRQTRRRLKKDTLETSAALDTRQNKEAVVWLLDHFVRERTKHYGDALARWHGWEMEGFFDHLQSYAEN